LPRKEFGRNEGEGVLVSQTSYITRPVRVWTDDSTCYATYKHIALDAN